MTIKRTTIATTLIMLMFLGCGGESINDSKQKTDEKVTNLQSEKIMDENISEYTSNEQLENTYESLQEAEETIYDDVAPQKSQEELMSEISNDPQNISDTKSAEELADELNSENKNITDVKSEEELISEMSSDSQNISDTKSDEELADELKGGAS